VRKAVRRVGCSETQVRAVNFFILLIYAVIPRKHTIHLNYAFIQISSSDTCLYSCNEFLQQMKIVYEVTGVRHRFDIRH